MRNLAQDKADIIAALDYRSGPDSCNSVYLGSMAVGMICHAVGIKYSDPVDRREAIRNASREQIDKALETAGPIIAHMKAHPTTACPTCGTHGITAYIAHAGEPVDVPYAYEFGRSNGDDTYSVFIERTLPKKTHPDWPVKPLFAAPQAQARVKVLEWNELYGDIVANTEVKTYRCSKFGDGWDMLIDGIHTKPYRHGVRETYSLEAAKAAAQADYERRVRSALDEQGPATPANERVVEALPYPPIVISTDAGGQEHRVGAHEWRGVERPDGGAVTISIYIGDHKWVEAPLDPKSAKTLADLILSKPCIAALAREADRG